MRKKITIVNFRNTLSSIALMTTFLLVIPFITTPTLAQPMLDDGNGKAVIPGWHDKEYTIEKLNEVPKSIAEFFSGYSTSEDNPPQSTTPVPGNNQDNPFPDKIPTTEVSALFEKIKQSIHGSCTQYGTGVVKKGNNSCVDSILPILGSRGKTTTSIMKQSAINYQNLQCVGCAVAAAYANGASYGGWGNANQHANQRVDGYTFVTRRQVMENPTILKPGSLFVMTGGVYGHIGMVTEINGSHSFTGFECNTKPGYVSHREYNRSFTNPSLAGFQVPL